MPNDVYSIKPDEGFYIHGNYSMLGWWNDQIGTKEEGDLLYLRPLQLLDRDLLHCHAVRGSLFYTYGIYTVYRVSNLNTLLGRRWKVATFAILHADMAKKRGSWLPEIFTLTHIR